MDVRPKAVVLVSGGIDSLVSLAIAQTSCNIAALHVSYGQLIQEREIHAFNEITEHYGITERLHCGLDALRQIGGSSLTDDRILISNADLNSPDIPTSYVPFRNAHFLSIAVSWAEVIGASSIYIGAVAEDSSGYPDCRREFYDAFERAVETGTKPDTDISIITPVIQMSKKDIILKGVELGAPLHLTWSCYQSSQRACGVCDSCALRLRAFQQAGLPDPIDYAIRPKYR